MTRRFFDVAFTPIVKSMQEDHGSRAAYARLEDKPSEADELTDIEAAFIAARDSFYMATVGETGWPYLQHRGGPAGFVKFLGPRTLGIADFRGNRQYVTLGNIVHDQRSALFFMDYPNRRRLKVLARTTSVDLEKEPALAARLIDADYGAKIERGLLFEIEAYDWNCSQHITPRYAAAEVDARVMSLKAEIETLRKALAAAGSAAR